MDSKATHVFTNSQIAKLLRHVSAAYTVLGKNKFRIAAYDKAAEAVDHATSEIKDLWDDGKLGTISGLGEALIEHLDELFRTGEVKTWKQTFYKVPKAMFTLLDLPGIGPTKAHELATKLGLKPDHAVKDLEKAAIEHKISPLEGFGYKSESDIMKSIALWRRGEIKERRILLSQATEIAKALTGYLKLCRETINVETLGSLRRQVSTIGDIDIAVSTKNPKKVIAHFVQYPKITQIIEQGPTGASLRLTSGRQVDLRVCLPSEWGSMLQYFTGSKQHNIHLREYAQSHGLSLSEYGIKNLKTQKTNQYATEEAFYSTLHMAWIPPELREDTGEIEAALAKNLPKLVTLADIRGNLHVHSDFDQETSHDSGLNSLSELQDQAQVLGYEYLGITNHNPKTDIDPLVKILKQNRAISKLNQGNSKTKILSLMEVDITPTGQLAVSQDALKLLDGYLVSIHSSFGMSRQDMTNRILKALSHPGAKIFAHPTGRLLEQREGYELAWDEVFAYCQKQNIALEINACPNRLDLPDILVREAIKRGVLLSLGTDAHDKSELNNMPYGVSVARRGWAQAENIINTWSYAKILKWMQERR